MGADLTVPPPHWPITNKCCFHHYDIFFFLRNVLCDITHTQADDHNVLFTLGNIICIGNNPTKIQCNSAYSQLQADILFVVYLKGNIFLIFLIYL